MKLGMRVLFAGGLLALTLSAPSLVGIACAEDASGTVQVARSSDEYKGWSYEDARREFQEAGFTDIRLVPIGDLNFVTAVFTHDGSVESVQVGESTGFTNQVTFAANTPVTITYHTFQKTIDEAERASEYDSAVSLFDSGKYGDALAKFQALGDYSDAQTWALRCQEVQRAASLSADGSEGLAEAPRASGEYEGWDYWNAQDELARAGFTNVTLNPVGDLILGLGGKDGKVTGISIDGQDTFTSEARFVTGAQVVITFHTFKDRIERGDYASTVADDVPDSSQRHYLGKTVKTGLDNGYSGSEDIGEKDAHYGWSLGEFFVSDFTRDMEDDDGNPVFLKNVGDTVELWFTLEQPISHLDGKASLTVADDTNGYCADMGVERTDLGRGALLVRKTDYQNHTEQTQVYTDYLAAKTTGADAKVQLFEEGDYEVSLLYELKDDPRRIGDLSVAPSYGNYRISFKFSVRNSNCMVYPFDVATGSELADGACTEDGFSLDLARSRYLDIDIRKEVLVASGDGTEEDTRFNRAARDGEQYTDPGLYTITVSNRYTGERTTKTICVGSEDDLKAFQKSKGTK